MMMNTSMIKTYDELVKLPSFEERFDYLKLGKNGINSFGFDRWINQKFYNSSKWRKIRDNIIIRDNGCDLGILDRQLFSKIVIHHMNPIELKDILDLSDYLLNENYLICCSHETHNAIHYADENLLVRLPKQRFKNDTCPWKTGGMNENN